FEPDKPEAEVTRIDLIAVPETRESRRGEEAKKDEEEKILNQFFDCSSLFRILFFFVFLRPFASSRHILLLHRVGRSLRGRLFVRARLGYQVAGLEVEVDVLA